MSPSLLALLPAAGLLLLAVQKDLCFRSVPNWISGAIVLLGTVLRFGDGTLAAAALAASLLFVCLAALWQLGILGGADVKLMAASGLLVPPASVPGYCVAVLMCGGVLSLCYLGLRVLPAPAFPAGRRRARLFRLERRRARRGDGLPYVLAVAAGAFISISEGLVA